MPISYEEEVTLPISSSNIPTVARNIREPHQKELAVYIILARRKISYIGPDSTIS